MVSTSLATTPAIFLASLVTAAAHNRTLIPSSSSTISPDSGDDAGSEYIYILPFIISFGCVGNAISLVAILQSRLRKTPANQYLIVLTAADSVFLLALLMIWAKLDYVAYQFCVIIEYILQVASYISSWSISALTIERYLAIAHPLRHIRYSHVNRYKMMCFWLPIPFILNIVQFYCLADPGPSAYRKCAPIGNLNAFVDTADVLLCYVLPCLIVVCLNLLVAAKVRNADKSFALPTKTTTAEASTCLPRNDSRRAGRPNSASAGSTRILLVVPVVYIILNTPFYLFRLIDTISVNMLGYQNFSEELSKNEFFVYAHNSAYYLYYINFACDVIVYAFSSANFRKTVVHVWRRKFCARKMSDATIRSDMVSGINLRPPTTRHRLQGQLITEITTPGPGAVLHRGSMPVLNKLGDAV
uniref:G_PROTEIN_RECEP_F1_2 domain-containing protein n=1 Tax=Panagrellus redivivus TaxID=6233 RepID=A0A7E4V881_PANRE